jgi:hypothetical protein
MMVVFKHTYFRETSIRRSPIDFGGFRLTLVRHEEAEFRVICPYRRLVEVAATNYPPEHWSEAGIRRSFEVFGQVCCVDKHCLRRVTDVHGDDGIADFSAVRVLVLLDEDAVITSLLLVRNPRGEVSGFAKLRLVDWWEHPADAPPPNDHDFPGDLRDDDSDSDGDGDSSRTSRYSPGWSDPGCRACTCPAFWATFAAGVFFALSRAVSLVGVRVPRVVTRTPVRPRTPPPAPPPSLASEVEEVAARSSCGRGHSPMPSLNDLLAEEEHKVRRRRRLAAKEDPLYTDATSNKDDTRVKAAQLDLSKASERMNKEALDESGVLERPPPARLRCLRRVCGLAHLSEVEDGV